MAEHLHEGHRQRMRERFLREGFANMQEHEVLEMLLFYAIPRVNTNELAHRLIDTFGSLYGVLTAEPAALRQVKGVTENAAVLLRMIPALYPVCMTDSAAAVRLPHFDACCEYFRKLYLFDTKEVLRMACVDDKLLLTHCVTLQEGDCSRIDASLAEIVRHCMQRQCSSVILAHNHPCGSAHPSARDLAATHALHEKLEQLHIDLLDHIIVGQDETLSMRKLGVYHFHKIYR